MKDIPIIFSAPMVQALIREVEYPGNGKTMTWRLAKRGVPYASPWRQVKIGDRMWVRENFCGPKIMSQTTPAEWGTQCPIRYVADGLPGSDWTRSRPSIHMPRFFSRLSLIVTATKVERLQAISEADARAEGIFWDFSRDPFARGPGACHYGTSALDTANGRRGFNTARGAFQELWNRLHGTGAWDANPEVVAMTFTVHRCNIDAMPKEIAA